MRVLVNIGERVEVELTEVGQKLWREYKTKPFENSFCVTSSLTIIRAPLWELMAAFGPHMTAGIYSDMRNVFFKDNEFELLEIGRR